MEPNTSYVNNAVPSGPLPATEFSGVAAAVVRALVDLERWFSTAEPGSDIAYHRGFLALDRGAGSRLGEDAGEELDRVASALMATAEAGHVHLIQTRHGAYDYTYLAVMGRAGRRREPVRRTPETAS
jgi:hypothetical protein